MTTQPTNLSVPSESPRDLKFNAGKIDEFVTSKQREYEDRFGNKHYTVEGLRWVAQQAISTFGYITLKSFQLGAPLPNNELTLPNQVLQDETNGEYYRWDGAFPKSVPENSTPASSGGVGVGAWIGVGDASLRSEITPDITDGENISQQIQNRKDALASNTIRFCTWNIEGFRASADQPAGEDYYDTSRYNRNHSNQQMIREHVEWLLRIGADVAAIQECYGNMQTKVQWKPVTTICSNWRMYPYVDSYLGIESVSKTTGSVGYTGGNMTLTTRSQANGSTINLVPSPTEDTIRCVARTEIVVNGVTIALYNAHLAVAETTLIQQIADIAAIVAQDTTPHIVMMGDWNWNDDAVYQPFINLGFTMVNHNGELGTYNGGNTSWGQWYLDRIFHKGFTAQGAYGVETPPRELGDHKPLWVDLTL